MLQQDSGAGEAHTHSLGSLELPRSAALALRSLITFACSSGASDIHLESITEGMLVRMRIDGVLNQWSVGQFPAQARNMLVAHIKTIGGMDVTQVMKPQDGAFRSRLPQSESGANQTDINLDIRVSSIPSVTGERVVMRLLYDRNAPQTLQELALSQHQLEIVVRVLSANAGMLLVVGPTGSGKSTTLASMLRERSSGQRNVMSIEDPVEHRLPGVAQIEVNDAHGMTFAEVLRALLRQDPDVIAVGEMRDAETARLGATAALTGHQVLTSLHAQDALGALTRLLDIGLPSWLAAATVRAVIAQRLLRRACTNCLGDGCAACRKTGYRGRVGVYEVLDVSPELIRRLVDRGEADTRAHLHGQQEHTSLVGSAQELVVNKITTPSEHYRVFGVTQEV